MKRNIFWQPNAGFDVNCESIVVSEELYAYWKDISAEAERVRRRVRGKGGEVSGVCKGG